MCIGVCVGGCACVYTSCVRVGVYMYVCVRVYVCVGVRVCDCVYLYTISLVCVYSIIRIEIQQCVVIMAIRGERTCQ